MRRIPIYKFINNAGLYMRCNGKTLAIGKVEWSLYLKKFFVPDYSKDIAGDGYVTIALSKEMMSSINKTLIAELETLKLSYQVISGKSFPPCIENPLAYDRIREEKEIEAFSISESLYRIIEFHIRFISFLNLFSDAERTECILPLSA